MRALGFFGPGAPAAKAFCAAFFALAFAFLALFRADLVSALSWPPPPPVPFGTSATGFTEANPGAVMAFSAHRNMQLGHVAAVSRVLDSRRVLLDHANWSPINGRRGQIEKDVLAVDVSPNNDWSEVRVWYAPLGKVGTTAWPVDGFIYSDRKPQPRRQIAMAPARKQTSKRFLSAFADFAD